MAGTLRRVIVILSASLQECKAVDGSCTMLSLLGLLDNVGIARQSNPRSPFSASSLASFSAFVKHSASIRFSSFGSSA